MKHLFPQKRPQKVNFVEDRMQIENFQLGWAKGFSPVNSIIYLNNYEINFPRKTANKVFISYDATPSHTK